ncbi:predicted protein [Sclerotinia sclerotiorum 1980 UF-70]|uniref:Uncharacterized protein n=2 Tax=Sclerotinia sclerotiorum (strain ATCC 18683 / 1980 / Ss-1) TaxID=665079 RepID=A7ENB1_SCLS1|nr:predicted protein [Sclerotinia sclerotiorum 1980 UF-70]APA14789.1 hypothetical protein sscle_13g095590 [Sclerotinia sclerotiorum 1980 UF-70]EDO04327.1 predicted protein [Sclerotinia sclerotiorum 1980 UF-70]
MDKHWDTKKWKPTIIDSECSMQPFVTLSPKDVETHREKLRVCTENLDRFPYTPENWRSRPEVLLKLGFPELATFDAYKTIFLANYVFDGEDRGSKVWLEMRMMMWYRAILKVPPKHRIGHLRGL